jgi:MFS family permease
MRQTLRHYGRILGLRNARLILAADVTSRAGDWLLYVAISLVLYGEGGLAALGVFNVARTLVPVLLSPFAGRWGAKYPPRRVMVAADVGRAVFVGAAGLLALNGEPTPVLLAAVLGAVLGATAIGTFFYPAEKLLQRDVIDGADRPAFNAVVGTSATGILVLAPALAGLLAAAVGPAWLLVLDGLSFAVSAVLVARLPTAVASASAVAPAVASVVAPPAPVWRAVRAGLADRPVRACILAQAAACYTVGASLVILVPVADSLHAGGATVGYLTAAIGVGSLVGMLVGGWLARRAMFTAATASVVALGALLMLFGYAGTYPAALAVAAAMGVAANLPEPLYWTTYQDRVPDPVAGAFFGAVESVITGSLVVGSAVAATGVAAFGLGPGAAATGAVSVVLAVLALSTVLSRTVHPVRAASENHPASAASEERPVLA